MDTYGEKHTKRSSLAEAAIAGRVCAGYGSSVVFPLRPRFSGEDTHTLIRRSHPAPFQKPSLCGDTTITTMGALRRADTAGAPAPDPGSDSIDLLIRESHVVRHTVQGTGVRR